MDYIEKIKRLKEIAFYSDKKIETKQEDSFSEHWLDKLCCFYKYFKGCFTSESKYVFLENRKATYYTGKYTIFALNNEKNILYGEEKHTNIVFAFNLKENKRTNTNLTLDDFLIVSVLENCLDNSVGFVNGELSELILKRCISLTNNAKANIINNEIILFDYENKIYVFSKISRDDLITIFEQNFKLKLN